MKPDEKSATYCGVEIFKHTFSAFCHDCYCEFNNHERGFNQLLEWCSGKWFLLKSTSLYSNWLVHYLYHHGNTVSVINPPHHFYSWKLRGGSKHKTDAALLVDFAGSWTLPAWKPKETHVEYIRQLMVRIESKANAISRRENLQEQLAITSKVLPGRLGYIQQLTNEKNKLECELRFLLNWHYGESYRQLITLPGLSCKSAVSLLAYLEELERG